MCNTAFLQDIGENLVQAGKIAPIGGAMAYGPPGYSAFFEQHLPAEIGRFEVWEPDFGRCLTRALEIQFAQGHKAACVLNSDSPTLPSSILVETARILETPGDRIVIGPSTDGGYYLLGCKSIHHRLFQDIAWSTDAVAGQTVERAAEIGIEVHVLPEWYDVDDAAALATLVGEVLDDCPFDPKRQSSAARHSAALLQRMRGEADLDRRLAIGRGAPAAAAVNAADLARAAG